jgi:hypothetical protein
LCYQGIVKRIGICDNLLEARNPIPGSGPWRVYFHWMKTSGQHFNSSRQFVWSNNPVPVVAKKQWNASFSIKWV